MRHLRIVIGFAAVSLAMGVGASSAFAEGFEAVPNPHVKNDTIFKEFGKKEGELSEQKFRIGPIKWTEDGTQVEDLWQIKCLNAKGSGTAPATPSPKLTVKVKFQKCTFTGPVASTPKSGVAGAAVYAGSAAKKEEPEFTYYGAGSVNPPPGSMTIDKEITIKLTAAKCNALIAAQTIEAIPSPSYEAFFPKNTELPLVSKQEKEEFPQGFRDALVIENKIVPHALGKPEEGEKPERLGLEYELEPAEIPSGPHAGEPQPKSPCTFLPEKAFYEYERGSKQEKVEIEPHVGVFGSYTGSDFKLELPKGELKYSR